MWHTLYFLFTSATLSTCTAVERAMSNEIKSLLGYMASFPIYKEVATYIQYVTQLVQLPHAQAASAGKLRGSYGLAIASRILAPIFISLQYIYLHSQSL